MVKTNNEWPSPHVVRTQTHPDNFIVPNITRNVKHEPRLVDRHYLDVISYIEK